MGRSRVCRWCWDNDRLPGSVRGQRGGVPSGQQHLRQAEEEEISAQKVGHTEALKSVCSEEDKEDRSRQGLVFIC